MHMKWDALHNLVPFVELIKVVQFVRTWKVLMEECYFSKVAGFSQIVQSTHAWVFFMVFQLYKWYQIALSIANNWKAEACNFNRSNTPLGCSSCLLNYLNGTASRWASQIIKNLKPATSLKVTLLPGCFSYFLNSANGIKSC